MAKARNDILWRFLADTKSLEKGNKRAQSGMKKTQKSTAGLTKAAGALGIAFGAGQVVRAFGSAINRAEEMNSLYAITEQVIQQTGNAAQLTADDVKEMASAMSTTTGIDKSVATEAANILLTFKNLKSGVGDTNGVFERTHALTADMATVMGGSATDAAKQLGKALNDPVTGLGGLSRAGVQFTKDQKKVIASLVETGDVAGAQDLVLQELETQLGGVAVASADSTELIARGWDEVSEVIGQELIAEIDDIAPTIIDAVRSSIPWIGKLAEGFGDVLGQVNELDGVIGSFNTGEGRNASQVWGDVTSAVTRYVGKIPLANGVTEQIADRMDRIGESGVDAIEGIEGLITVLASRYPPAAQAVIQANRDIGGSFDDAKGRAEEAGFAFLTAIGLGNFEPKGPTGLENLLPATTRGIEGFHTGGVVGGPAGSEQLITAKAGERVTTRGHGGGGGGDINITIEAGIGDPVAIAEQVRDLLNLYDRTNGSF